MDERKEKSGKPLDRDILISLTKCSREIHNKTAFQSMTPSDDLRHLLIYRRKIRGSNVRYREAP